MRVHTNTETTLQVVYWCRLSKWTLRSICKGVLCGLKPSHPQSAREWSKRNSRELTPCRDSAGPPLSSGCGPWPHSLGNCWGLWKEKIQFKPFLLCAVPAYCLWQAVLRLRGRWVLVKHVGRQTCCLWPGSPVSPRALALTAVPDSWAGPPGAQPVL